jgi:hypothetical protein
MPPDERIRINIPGRGITEADAYLVESRSWGGQSGSPVFVFFPSTRMPSGPLQREWEGKKVEFPDWPLLLGVVQGHFDIREPLEVIDKGTNVSRKLEWMAAQNSGIAVVLPAKQILELI